MTDQEHEIWTFLDRHLRSIFSRDSAAYRATTGEDLSLYEWFVTPHRQDGLDFHFFMIDHSWAGKDLDFRYDLLEPRLQLYGDTAIVSYTFMPVSYTHLTLPDERSSVDLGGRRIIKKKQSTSAIITDELDTRQWRICEVTQ